MGETLVVVSKVKKYVKDKAQMSTSAAVMDELTKKVEMLLDKAIENAKNDGRKTVMDRDIPNTL